MKASELIVQLQELIKQHGDLPLFKHDMDYGWTDIPIYQIKFEIENPFNKKEPDRFVFTT